MESKTEPEKEFLFKIETSTLLDVIKNIKEFKTEIILNLNNEGLKIFELDPSSVCLTEINLKKYLFIDYEIKDSVKIGINTTLLYKAIKDLKKTQLSLFKDNHKLYIEFNNGFKTELDLITIEDPEINKPFFEEILLTFRFNSKRFKEIIKQFSNITDSLKIEIDKQRVFFKGHNETDKNNKIEIELNPEEFKILKDIDYKIIKSRYSIDYLKNCVKSLIHEDVVLSLNEDHPLFIEYITDSFNIKYILAPRVGED